MKGSSKNINKIIKEVKFHYEMMLKCILSVKKYQVMATKYLKTMNIFNTMEFKTRQIIRDDDKYFFMINDKRFTEKEFGEYFIPSFCLKVYKFQGERFALIIMFDVNRMDKKQIYTVMSRTTRFNNIHLDENMLLKFYYNIKPPVLERINAKQNSLFKMVKYMK